WIDNVRRAPKYISIEIRISTIVPQRILAQEPSRRRIEIPRPIRVKARLGVGLPGSVLKRVDKRPRYADLSTERIIAIGLGERTGTVAQRSNGPEPIRVVIACR